MAFADTLLSETKTKQIVMVDRYAKAGGHWNVAYSFVTLHQPSRYYGVSSLELSKNRIDRVGVNRGMHDLATGAEVSAYYDEVRRHRFLPGGRVRYYPLCDYRGEGRFKSRLSGDEFHVKYKKIVDATYLNTFVPATHTSNFKIAEEACFMPLNDLVKIKTRRRRVISSSAGVRPASMRVCGYWKWACSRRKSPGSFRATAGF